MRTALISDIHANLPALEAVLGSIERERVDRVACLGDIVGGGADPQACCERVRERCDWVCAGLYEHTAIGRVPISGFGAAAQEAVRWTQAQLGEPWRAWMAALPLTAVLLETERELPLWEAWRGGDDVAARVLADLRGEQGAAAEPIAIAYASFADPERFEEVHSLDAARRCDRAQPTRVGFIGHTHMPSLVRRTAPDSAPQGRRRLPIQGAPDRAGRRVIPLEGDRALADVDSVGQPGDGDPRAAFVIYDDADDAIEWHRVPYDVEQAMARIRAAGLPEFLAARLAEAR